MKRKIHIYAIYFPTNGKYYIGRTYNLKRRVEYHLSHDSLVHRALYKYDDWQISVLHTTRDRDQANLLEIEEIRNHNSIRPNGYNLTRGGDGIFGYHHTEETRKIISEAHKGDKNPSRFPGAGAKISAAKKGCKRPDIIKRNKNIEICHNIESQLKWYFSRMNFSKIELRRYLNNKLEQLEQNIDSVERS